MAQGTLFEEYVVAARMDYFHASREFRAGLLDRFVEVTGFHRKSAIRTLNRPQGSIRKARQGSSRYEPRTAQALYVIWAGLGCPCSKRLQPMLVQMSNVFERHSEIALTDSGRRQLETMSPATIDRLLRPFREGAPVAYCRWRDTRHASLYALGAANRALTLRGSAGPEVLRTLCLKLRLRMDLYSILFQLPMSSNNSRRYQGDTPSGPNPLQCLVRSEQVSVQRLSEFQATYERINPVNLLRQIDTLSRLIKIAAGQEEGANTGRQCCGAIDQARPEADQAMTTTESISA